jgi:hypothetical protein
MVEKFEAPYGLVFNLDQYTGNYEREFCGFVFGALGDCRVGDGMVAFFEEDHPKGSKFYALRDICRREPDDNGCYRPVSIYRDAEFDVPEVGHGIASLIVYLDSKPNDEDMALIVARAKQFCVERPDWHSYRGERQPLTLKGIKLISNKVERVQRVEKSFDLS